MDHGSLPATNAGLKRLDEKLDASVQRLDDKIGSSVKGLDDKIDSAVKRLDEKIDSAVKGLDEKIDSAVKRLDDKIDSSTTRLAKQIVAGQAEMREIKETMATKKDVERILVAVESFAGKTQVYDRAAVLHGRALTETEISLRDHEKRLRALEGRRF